MSKQIPIKNRASQAQRQRGISIIELLVALVIGLTILSAASAFLFQTSRTVQMGEQDTKNTSRAQQVLSRMSREIKGVSVAAPPLYNVSLNWANLPALPYSALELTPYLNTAGTVDLPTVPAARKYASQATPADIYHKWYPNPTANESNSLVFYRAPAPGPGGVSTIERVTYRLLANGDLLREVQRPIVATSTSFQATPAPRRSILAKDVISIQFTYPNFEQAMNASLDSQLTTIQTNDGNPAVNRFMNANFRKAIGIRIVMSGAVRGATPRPGIELSTEVRLRSE